MKLINRLARFAASFVLCIPPASATSYVAAYGNHRIILAGDGKTKGSPEKTCKITMLGRYAFAASGLTENKSVPGDRLKSWAAALDAKTAFARHPRDLNAMAAEWAKLQAARFTEFYKVNPGRIKSIAATSGFLVSGTFVGFDSNGEPIAVTENIAYDGSAKAPIVQTQNITPLRQRAYCSDPVTEELFEDNSARAHHYDMEWQKLQRTTPRADFDWRYTQFLIQSTADLEDKNGDGVGREVDILAITPSTGPAWLQKNSCR